MHPCIRAATRHTAENIRRPAACTAWTEVEFAELVQVNDTCAFISISFKKQREFYAENGAGDSIMNCDTPAVN